MAMSNFQFSILNFQKKRGFALLIAVIFMSVMLSLGLALSSIGYKQQVLASTATESQYAFYAADAGMECALYADQRQDLFNYSLHSQSNPPNFITCAGTTSTVQDYSYNQSANGVLQVSEYLSLDASRCAKVTIYKYAAPQQPSGAVTKIFSEGYDVSCSTVQYPPTNARFVARGISIHY